MEIQKHLTDANDNHFVTVFKTKEAADDYNERGGSNEIVAPPTPNHRWIDEAWAVPAPESVTVDQVKAEADRRITALVGAQSSRQKDIRISNATQEAVKLLRLGEANWTAEQATRAAVLEGLDAAIDAISDKSNMLEAVDPIPDDFRDDAYWP